VPTAPSLLMVSYAQYRWTSLSCCYLTTATKSRFFYALIGSQRVGVVAITRWKKQTASSHKLQRVLVKVEMEYAQWQSFLDYAVGRTPSTVQRDDKRRDGRSEHANVDCETGASSTTRTSSALPTSRDGAVEDYFMTRALSGKIMSLFSSASMTGTSANAPAATNTTAAMDPVMVNRSFSPSNNNNNNRASMNGMGARADSSSFEARIRRYRTYDIPVDQQATSSPRSRTYINDNDDNPVGRHRFNSIGDPVDEEEVYHNMYSSPKNGASKRVLDQRGRLRSLGKTAQEDSQYMLSRKTDSYTPHSPTSNRSYDFSHHASSIDVDIENRHLSFVDRDFSDQSHFDPVWPTSFSSYNRSGSGGSGNYDDDDDDDNSSDSDIFENMRVASEFVSHNGTLVDEDDVYDEMNPIDSQFCNISLSSDAASEDAVLQHEASPQSTVPAQTLLHLFRSKDSPSSQAATTAVVADEQVSSREAKLHTNRKSKKTKVTKRRRPKHLPEEKHIRWWGHGKLWTAIAVVACLSGTALSILTRRSYAFVRLEKPFYVSPTYDPLYSVGMLRLLVCYNTTITGQTGCEDLDLSAEDVQDNMFELSRMFLSLGTSMGAFFTIFLTSAVFWESINLKPLGFGFLVAYFFQSFSMLFYDTQICASNKCQMGPGSLMSIAASLCWITACVAAAKMDYFKTRARRERRREARRKYKETKKGKSGKRERSRKEKAYTERTNSTTSSDASSEGGNPVYATEESQTIPL
jgi:hypothetical protein